MSNRRNALVPYEQQLPAELSPAEGYLQRIRPQWQATPLVNRVRKLLPVDPSSACQRLLNAAGHDLRVKIRTLGIDLAKDVAKTYGLPPVNTDEDLEDYPTARLYDLAYRLGLLTRPEWRRLHRAYEIRRDLEHEDDEYEASTGDLIYIFETAIEVVLSREPVQVIRLQDITEVVESDSPVLAPDELIEDFRAAPLQRQTEIIRSLAFGAIDENRPELVKGNCYRLLKRLAPIAPPRAKISLAEQLQVSIGRRPQDVAVAQVAIASGAFPFIHRRQQRLLVNAFLERFDSVKPDWRHHPYHGEVLDDFAAAGGFAICPNGAERKVVRWMVEAYIGEPGRYGTFGRNRAVFYSDTAAPRIEKILSEAPPQIKGVITAVASENATRKLAEIPEQRTRLARLVEMTSSATLEKQ